MSPNSPKTQELRDWQFRAKYREAQILMHASLEQLLNYFWLYSELAMGVGVAVSIKREARFGLGHEDLEAEVKEILEHLAAYQQAIAERAAEELPPPRTTGSPIVSRALTEDVRDWENWRRKVVTNPSRLRNTEP